MKAWFWKIIATAAGLLAAVFGVMSLRSLRQKVKAQRRADKQAAKNLELRQEEAVQRITNEHASLHDRIESVSSPTDNGAGAGGRDPAGPAPGPRVAGGCARGRRYLSPSPSRPGSGRLYRLLRGDAEPVQGDGGEREDES